METTLGGDRLGSGNKQKIHLRNYERSSHDLGYLWRSTMASGTLTPFLTEVALPGDSFDIDLNCDIKTHPTIGPLFGSYKVQLDVFQCPIRLYQGQLHMNKLGIGMDMSSIKLPVITMGALAKADDQIEDNDQINASSIFSYLNIRGLGRTEDPTITTIEREFNAIPYLAYWDIYKNYYANKQEEIGAVIHNPATGLKNIAFIDAQFVGDNASYDIYNQGVTVDATNAENNNYISIKFENDQIEEPSPNGIILATNLAGTTYLTDVFTKFEYIKTDVGRFLICSIATAILPTITNMGLYQQLCEPKNPTSTIPQITTFPLSNIDDMREDILEAVKNTNPFQIVATSQAPYGLALTQGTFQYKGRNMYSKQSALEGLGLKTYQSDLFNNWISTEWIEGSNGISAITAIDTSAGNFTIDTLNLSRKVYDMLNRIAISGGRYDDWLDATYTHERVKPIESPMYLGGLSKEIVFQEVISNSEASTPDGTQPLGTLAGRGVMSNKHKGGTIKIRIDEPSYLLGIVSITPRIDFSQGNKFDVNLKTMDDFHKPALDEIGFQDLITDQMAWFDTLIQPGRLTTFKSAGKQPAWINYMTNVNQVRGNFANENDQMFMTLNRRYEYEQGTGIKDLTTYIDPSKFNHIFADTRTDAQNFWTQISANIFARRKMSAKVMPNL